MAKRTVRSYTQAERTAAMTLAVQVGCRKAARETGIPPRTISNWLKRHGGYVEIRAVSEATVLESLRRTELAIIEEMERRIKKFPDSELAETYRTFVVTRAKAGAIDQPVQQQSQQIIVNLYEDKREPGVAAPVAGPPIIDGEAVAIEQEAGS